MFNVVVLAALLGLFLTEEIRFRLFSSRVRRMRSTLLAAAYQIRSPLSTLKKYTDMLQRREIGSLSVTQMEAMARMNRAREDLTHQMNRFLAASRLEEGMIASSTSRVRLGKTLGAVIDGLQDHVRKGKVRVKVSPSARSATLVTDELLLHGILDEVLQNAVVYSPGGTVDVRVKRPRGRLTVDISDTGIGLNAEEKKHLFEKFFRGERARAMYHGSGLGLYFSREFARALGGDISVTSVAKKTTVTVELPLRKR